ncbi:MAG: dUTP diphosphatase [Armatimonadota bacterium]|nr:dUTP diphosphatase [Armatimonadota bacterium]
MRDNTWPVVDILIERLPEAQDLPLPSYATEGSSGLDLLAAVETDLTIKPGERKLTPTGIRVAIPPGYEAQIRPRSGLALKHGISMVNTPGTIDSDYRGPVQIIVINLGSEPYTIKRGDRIAQMVICPVVKARIVERNDLPDTIRGDGGFGHTGLQ